MKITVKLFAAAKEAVGSDSLEIELPQPGTIATLKSVLTANYPELSETISRSAFAVDHEYAVDATELNENMEVGLIPPVSGG